MAARLCPSSKRNPLACADVDEVMLCEHGYCSWRLPQRFLLSSASTSGMTGRSGKRPPWKLLYQS